MLFVKTKAPTIGAMTGGVFKQVIYRLQRLSLNEFLIFKGDVTCWEVKFVPLWTVKFGFEALAPNGQCFRLKEKGLFWWRKLFFSVDGDQKCVFSTCRSLTEAVPIRLKPLNKVAFADKPICEFRKGGTYNGAKLVLSWEHDQEDLESYVNALALISIQGKATVAGTPY